MNKLLLSLTFVLTCYSSMLCQHPNTFLKDVYDVEWCQNLKIKSLKSGGTNYTLINGVPISDKANEVVTEVGGTVIKQTIGRGNFHLDSYLTSDLKRLQSTKTGGVSTHYFYDDENLLSYKVNHVNIRPKGGEYNSAFSLEKMSRNSTGQLIKKEFYSYKEPIIKHMGDYEKTQSMDRRLSSVWEYKYNAENELIEVVIKNYSLSDDSEKVLGVSIVKVEHKNGVPTSLEISSSGKTPTAISSKRNFSYGF